MPLTAPPSTTAEVDFFALDQRKPRRIDVEMLDYDYVAKCEDVDELKGILALLRTGQEGRYPHLEATTENRILSLLPEHERRKIQRMRAGPTSDELEYERAELASWTAEMDVVHRTINEHAPSAVTRDIRQPPVRGKQPCAPLDSPQMAKSLIVELPEGGARGTATKAKQAIPAYDFRAWEKYDADQAVEDIDRSEAEIQDRARKAREQQERRARERRKELASLPSYVSVEEMSTTERQVLARVEKQKGNDSFRANENEEAVLYYTRSMAFDDTEAVVYANRAAAHLRLKNFVQAEDDCTRAILLDGSYIKAWSRRGMTRFRRGKYEEAVGDFEEALQLDPGNREIIKLLKKTQDKWKEIDGTVEDNQVSHDRVNRLSPDPEHVTTEQPANAKEFTRFQIIEDGEDDEDDDEDDDGGDNGSGPTAQRVYLAPTKERLPFQRFEILED